MPRRKKIFTEAQKQAVAFLTRPKPDLSVWRAAREAVAKKEAEEEQAKAVASDDVGYKMLDGTIYAGISPDTKKPMYATVKDAFLSYDFGADLLEMGFNEAAKYAEELEVGGKKGFRLPTKDEIHILFQSRDKGALKGTFNRAGYYWSSTPCASDGAYYQRFSDGVQGYFQKGRNIACVRCVRS